MEAALRPMAGEVGFGDSCCGRSLPRMAGVGKVGPHCTGCALTEREGERAQGGVRGPSHTGLLQTLGCRLLAWLCARRFFLPALASSPEPRLPGQRRRWLGLGACVRFQIRTVEVQGRE